MNGVTASACKLINTVANHTELHDTNCFLYRDRNKKINIIKRLNYLDRNALKRFVRRLLNEPLSLQNSFLTRTPRPGNVSTKTRPAPLTYKPLPTADRWTAAQLGGWCCSGGKAWTFAAQTVRGSGVFIDLSAVA